MKKLLLLSLLFSTGILAGNSTQKTEPGENGQKRTIGSEMVLIEAGVFTMGARNGEKDEQPVHRVTLSHNFYLAKYEVTFEEYDLFCSVTGVEKPDDNGWGRDKRPVINISWEDAEAYTAWLSGVTGETYRLPTEAEWEYAARAGSTADYGFGGDPEALGTYAWSRDNSMQKTHERGGKEPNAWGLYDMHGNVWEWCEDTYAFDYRGAPSNGSANECYGTHKVVRGGSWKSDPKHLRLANRFRDAPSRKRPTLGFRLARDE